MFIHRAILLTVCPTPPPDADPPDIDPSRCRPLRVGQTLQMQTPSGWADPPGCRPPQVGQTPWMQTPRVGQTPWMQTCPGLGRPPPQVGQTPMDADSPPPPTHTQGWADPSNADGCRPPPDTVNKWAVRILLECILVIDEFMRF